MKRGAAVRALRRRGRLDSMRHPGVTLLSREGDGAGGVERQWGTREQESKLIYHGSQSPGIPPREMTTSISLKPMSVFMAFMVFLPLSSARRIVLEIQFHSLTPSSLEAFCTGLVPQICRCFPKSDGSLQWLPCHLKYLLDREE